MPRSEKKFEQIRQNPIVFGSSSRFGGCPQSLGIRTRDLRWNTLFDRSCAHKSLWTRLVRIGLPVDTGPSSLTRRRAVCAACVALWWRGCVVVWLRGCVAVAVWLCGRRTV